ncbi:MAG: hypothetical protein ACPG06_01915 [Alphaproteobacteria bacterium]
MANTGLKRSVILASVVCGLTFLTPLTVKAETQDRGNWRTNAPQSKPDAMQRMSASNENSAKNNGGSQVGPSGEKAVAPQRNGVQGAQIKENKPSFGSKQNSTKIGTANSKKVMRFASKDVHKKLSEEGRANSKMEQAFAKARAKFEGLGNARKALKTKQNECFNKGYTPAEQQKAGCKQNDNYQTCAEKLLEWCTGQAEINVTVASVGALDSIGKLYQALEEYSQLVEQK